MGYTHYIRRPKQINNFESIANDFKKVADFIENEMGIDLADGSGDKDTRPEIEATTDYK